jgi:SAM-dependent methyltransferase
MQYPNPEEPGVIRIDSEQQLKNMRFDFVMTLGVLEHCSEPAQVLEQLRSCLKPGGLLCIGVPYERYGIGFAGRGDLYRSYLNALLHFPAALTAVEFYSAMARIKLNHVPPLGFIKCHEHLNFFNQQSMSALLVHAGFQAIDSAIEYVAKYPARLQSLHMLAQLR